MRCHEKGPVPERGSLGNAWVVESSLLLGTLGALGGLLGSAPVMPVNRCSAADFIARGGRIPAPLHSLKN